MGNEKKWAHWNDNLEYGKTFFKRAVGELPEMESSKSMAKELSSIIKPGYRVLDVGCGAGHYLKSLRSECGNDFFYTGIDATQNYIQFAVEAYKKDSNCEFKVSDIYNITLPDQSYDIVMCSNVLLHMPSIEKPLSELIRVSRFMVFIRFLCGDRSFRIMEVDKEEERYDENGEPLKFQYYNIYGEKYIQSLLSSNDRVKDWSLEGDSNFSGKNIVDSVEEHSGKTTVTNMYGDYQVLGYILLPWKFLKINL